VIGPLPRQASRHNTPKAGGEEREGVRSSGSGPSADKANKWSDERLFKMDHHP